MLLVAAAYGVGGAAGGPALLPPAGDCRSSAAADGRLAGAGQPGVEAPASGGDDDERERPLSPLLCTLLSKVEDLYLWEMTVLFSKDRREIHYIQ